MNDEEFRGILGSASAGSGKDQDPAKQADENAGENAAAPPSFDELLGFAPPSAEPATAPLPALGGSQEAEIENSDPFAELFGEGDADESPGQTEDSGQQPNFGDWSQTYAQDDQELVPLILPGFSPDPQPKSPLPPVFQAEPRQPEPPVEVEPTLPDMPLPPPIGAVSPTRGASEPSRPAPVAASAGDAFIEPAPTEPYDMNLDASVPSASAAPLAPPPVPPVPSRPVQSRPAPRRSRTEPSEKISVTGGEPRNRRALPWIIVGIGVVIAIVASLLIVNLVRGQAEPEPAPAPTPTPSPAPAPAPSPAPTPAPAPTPTPEPEDGPPTVEVGAVVPMEIAQWNLTVDVPTRMPVQQYHFEDAGNARLLLTLPVAEELPESCSQARTGWGLLREGTSNTLEVIRPEPRCSTPADAAVYDTIWALVNHMAKSAKSS